MHIYFQPCANFIARVLHDTLYTDFTSDLIQRVCQRRAHG